MKHPHPVAIIGGTGKAGKYIVQQFIAKGYSLKLLLRRPEEFQDPHPQIQIVGGDARDPQAVHHLLDNCRAIVSAVGQTKGEAPVFSAVSRNIVAAMNDWRIRRYIALTGVNVDTPMDHKTGYATAATEWMKINYPKTTADKQVEWEELSNTSIDWTLVRLPMIQMTEIPNETGVSLTDCLGENISATSLAHFLVDQLKDQTFYRKAPFVFNR